MESLEEKDPALALSVDLEHRLLIAGRDAEPREACGLLLGRREGSLRAVVELVELRNLDSEERGYRLDPAEHLLAERRAEAGGLAVLGAWHSHPNGDSRPSRSDLRGTPPGWCQLILSADGTGGGRLGAWHRGEDGFHELRLIRRGPEDRPGGGRTRQEGLQIGSRSFR